MSIVGENLKRLVSERGKSLMWLSKLSGVSKYTIYTITRSESIDVRPSTLNLLARALNVPVEELTKDQTTVRENKEHGITIKKDSNLPFYIVESKGSDSSYLEKPLTADALIRKKYDITKSPDELQLNESERIGYFELLEHTHSRYWRSSYQLNPYYDPDIHGYPSIEALTRIEERRTAENIILDTMFDLTPENRKRLVQHAIDLIHEQRALYEQLRNRDKHNTYNKEETE